MALLDNQEIMSAYERLFRNFRDDAGEFKYTNLINRMTRDDNRSLIIDYEDLILMDDMFESDLVDTLLKFPQKMFEIGSEVLKEQVKLENPDYYQQVRSENFFVRFNNLQNEINIRDIRANNENELRWLEGIIIRTTEIKSIINTATFICQENAEHVFQLKFKDGIYSSPQNCSFETCKSKAFRLDQDSSKMVDWQFITLQEKPENLPPGASPKSIPCQLVDDQVNAVRPGDRVVIGGIVRSRPTRTIRKGQLLTFDTWVEVNYVESITKDDEFSDITPDEEAEFLDMARDPKIFDRLLESLAPAIYGMEEVKQASLLMLFGGVDKIFPDGFSTRGQPNVLLVGDPGVAKCVTGDTQVLLSDGSVKPIEEIVNNKLEINSTKINDGYYAKGEISIFNLNNIGRVKLAKANIFWKRKSPEKLYKIKTQSGKSIKVTPTHPFFVTKDGKVSSIKACDLKIGGFIATPRYLPVVSDNNLDITIKTRKINSSHIEISDTITPEFARLLGYVCGDGFVKNTPSSQVVWFNNSKKEVIEDYIECVNSSFSDLTCTIRDSPENKTIKDVYISTVELGYLLNKISFSFDMGASKKRVPNVIMSSTDEIAKNFLIGYFDSNSTVSKNKATISATSASKNLLSSIRILLLRFRIISQLGYAYSKSQTLPRKKYFRLKITSIKEFNRLKSRIDFNSRNKNLLNKSLKSNSNLDLIPNLGNLLSKIRRECGISQSEMGIPKSTYQLYERGDSNPSRVTLRKIVKNLYQYQLTDDISQLESLVTSDIFWDQVISIKKIKSHQEWVYDLQVAETHNFIANGFFVHNSQLLRYVQAIAPRGLYTSGKGSSAAGLCVAGDSKIYMNDTYLDISDVVEESFRNEDIIDYKDGIQYVTPRPQSMTTLHSENLKIKESEVERTWKLRSPRKWVRIVTKTGKSLKITPQTSIFTINQTHGLVWKQALLLEKNDRIAALRILPVSEIQPPNMFELLDNYPSKITLCDLHAQIRELTVKIKKVHDWTDTKISQFLNIHPSSIAYSKQKGVISYTNLIKLCKLAGKDPVNLLHEKIKVKLNSGAELCFPVELNSQWFYIFGLLLSDGRMSKSGNGYGGVSVGISNRDKQIHEMFRSFVIQIGLNTNFTPGSASRAAETRVHCKLLGHIFNQMGMPYSPKSHKIRLPNSIISYPQTILTTLLRGLFDVDGWIHVRKNTRVGSSHIGYSTTSQDLALFIQKALLRFSIVSNLRTRTPKTTTTQKGSIIKGKYLKYELSFSKFSDFRQFYRNIGFSHPNKLSTLKEYVQTSKINHSNEDTIPGINQTIREILSFYNIASPLVADRKGAFSKSNDITSYTRKRLMQVLEAIDITSPDWRNHRLSLSAEFKNEIRNSLMKIKEKDILLTLKITKTQFYDFFLRKQRLTKLPVGLLCNLLQFKNELKTSTSQAIEKFITKVKLVDEDLIRKMQFLKSLSISHIYWDTITTVDFIDKEGDFVYDLTIPKSHNFVVNDFIVHNTAAIIREPETGEITLEAGALVLADRGVCLAADTEILGSNGQLLKIQDIVEDDEQINVLSYNSDNFSIENDTIIGTSKRLSSDVYTIKFSTGDKITASKEHPLPTWDNGLIWKTIENINVDDIIIDFRNYPFKTVNNCPCINSEMTEAYAEFLGLIVSLGNLAEKKYRINFYSKKDVLIERYSNLCENLFNITPSKYSDPRSEGTQLYFDNKTIHQMIVKSGIPKGNKSNQNCTISHLLHERKSIVEAFICGVINGDGSVSNRKEGGIIDIVVGNKDTTQFYRKLLRKIGVIARAHEIIQKEGGVGKKGENVNYKISIAGASNIKKIDFTRLISYKRENLLKILKRRDNSDVIYKIEKLINSINKDLSHSYKQLLYRNNIRKSTLSKYGINRLMLEETLIDLNQIDELTVSKELQLLNKIIENEVYFIKVTSKDKVKSQTVYNIHVRNNNTYFANFIPVHNCLIDEFDKMNENDRSAIHEAMEQHSYHPATEITFADGSISQIGDYVDNLFDQNPDKIINGVDCEILPLHEKETKINTTDFEEYFAIPIARVSRHIAPECFLKITFSNGRDVVVTPEHPMYIYDHGITTIDAIDLKPRMNIPAPKIIEYSNECVLKTDFDTETKIVNLPDKLDTSLASFLGYFVSKGFSYHDNTFEVGLSNSNSSNIEEMKSVILESFKIEPLNYTDCNRTLRITSKSLYKYLMENFPEMMTKSNFKRIPRQLFSTGKQNRIAFLRSAFIGSGSVETETCAYSTGSKGLSQDYQDLLLTLGIHTRINSEMYDNNNENIIKYKVYIRGDSIELFALTVITDNKLTKLANYRKKLETLIERANNKNRKKDGLPRQVSKILKYCILKLGIVHNGLLYQHIDNDDSISIELAMNYVKLLKDRYQTLVNSFTVSPDFSSFRRNTGYSQKKISLVIGCSRGNVDYYERGGYNSEKRLEMKNKFQKSYTEYLDDIFHKIVYVQNLCKFKWLTIKSIERVPNKGFYATKWVYDVTVEPTKSFISQGVILHNTVSVAKAGIVATLNARTGVMAAANPKYGRYEDHRTFSENVNLSPAILSRFDLVFIIRDKPMEEHDTVLANHILNLHRFHGSGETIKPQLNEEQLKKYIAYSKKNYNPTISAEAAELIETYYVNMRNRYAGVGENPQERITITARQLEGIIRLAEAKTRAGLKTEVSKSDAQYAIDLIQYSLNQIATDPDTGALDIDAFYSGQTSSRRSKLNKLLSVIDFVYRDIGGKFKEDQLIEATASEGLSEDYVKGAIRQMLRDGTLYQPRVGYLDKP